MVYYGLLRHSLCFDPTRQIVSGGSVVEPIESHNLKLLCALPPVSPTRRRSQHRSPRTNWRAAGDGTKKSHPSGSARRDGKRQQQRDKATAGAARRRKMPSSVSEASATATATPAAVHSSGSRVRRIRPRSAPLSPPLNAASPGRIIRSGSPNVRREPALGNISTMFHWRRGTPTTTLGLSVPISLIFALLAVSGGAAPAAAAAAAAVAAPRSSPLSSSSLPPSLFPSTSPAARTVAAAFCVANPPPNVAAVIASAARGAGMQPPSYPRRPRRRSSTSAATGRSRAPLCRGRVTPSCSWSAGAAGGAATPSSSAWATQGSSRTGWFSDRRRIASTGPCGDSGSRRLSRSRPGSRVEALRADGGSGGGGAKEMDHRSRKRGRGRSRKWEVEGDCLSSAAAGISSEKHSRPNVEARVATRRASALSERDAARLKEVGIMVEELERDGAGLEATPALASPPPLPVALPVAPAPEAAGIEASSAHRATDSADFAGLLGGGGGGDGGSRLDNANLRMSCGDPVFFSHLAELIEGVHRHSGGRKFLTHAEEMELGEKVQRYRGLIEAQEKEEKKTGRKPPLREVARRSAGLSEKELVVVMQDGMEARQKLVVCNLALVVSLSNKYKRSHFDCSCLQTLIQEGTIGLIRAAERYNPEKGFRFTTYAIWWIEARLRVSVQTEERMIHLPMWIKNQYNTVIRSIPKLREALGRDPTPKELAAQVEIDTKSKVVVSAKRIEQLQTWVSFHRKHESLDVPLQLSTSLPPDFTTIEQGVKASEPSTESTSALEIQRDFLESCLTHDLSKIQRKILRMKVGLGGQKGKNRQEISRALKIPFNSIISEERKAFYKLRGLQRAGGYPSFGELK